MSGLLIDTCVLSELKKESPNKGVLAFFKKQTEKNLYLSVITIGELAKGIGLLPKSKKRTRLEDWLSGLENEFSSCILPITTDIARLWGELLASSQLQGKSRPAIDTMIAATALAHNLKLVTRNEADFEHTGVRIINPWKI